MIAMTALLSTEPREMTMATLTIRNLEDSVKKSLRIRAAHNERSMEEEARVILRRALEGQNKKTTGLGTVIHQRFTAEGGFNLEAPRRSEKPVAAIFDDYS